jgi:hypothetical protein
MGGGDAVECGGFDTTTTFIVSLVIVFVVARG